MSSSLEFNPVPAFELLKQICFADEARRIFDSMTNAEKESFNTIMDRCRYILSSGKIPPSRILVFEDVLVTENIANSLTALGYQSRIIDESKSFGPLARKLLIIDL